MTDAGPSGATHVDLENYRLDLRRGGSGTLIVSFQPMTAVGRDRSGWSRRLLWPRAEDLLFVKPVVTDWYRKPDLWRWFESSRALFSDYDRVVPIGGSMGGYAALAFAEVTGATDILSLNPQTTLASDLVPWEQRFPVGRAMDWSGDYRDAAATIPPDARTFVVADPYERGDRAHVDRLPAAVTRLNFPFVGHRVPQWLIQLGALDELIAAVIERRDPAPAFNAAIRRRRTLQRWWSEIIDRATRRGREDLVRSLGHPSRWRDAVPMPDGVAVSQANLYRAAALAMEHESPEDALAFITQALELRPENRDMLEVRSRLAAALTL